MWRPLSPNWYHGTQFTAWIAHRWRVERSCEDRRNQRANGWAEGERKNTLREWFPLGKPAFSGMCHRHAQARHHCMYEVVVDANDEGILHFVVYLCAQALELILFDRQMESERGMCTICGSDFFLVFSLHHRPSSEQQYWQLSTFDCDCEVATTYIHIN